MVDATADLEAMLRKLRELGVKTATFLDGVVSSVEFFPSIPALDLETLVPPAKQTKDDDVPSNIPDAFKRLLKKPSVS